jgi:hypothetical protein
VVIRLAGPARRMTTGTKRGGVRMTLHGFPGPNARLTALDGGSYTLDGVVGFPILQSTPFRSHLGHLNL